MTWCDNSGLVGASKNGDDTSAKYTPKSIASISTGTYLGRSEVSSRCPLLFPELMDWVPGTDGEQRERERREKEGEYHSVNPVRSVISFALWS